MRRRMGRGLKLSRRRQLEVMRRSGVLLPASTASWLKALCVAVTLILVTKEWFTRALPEAEYQPRFNEELPDLSRVSAYWRTHFNTTYVNDTDYTGLMLSAHGIKIITDGVPQKPYITGLQGNNAFLVRIRRALVYNNPIFAKESGYKLVPTTAMDKLRHHNLARFPNVCSQGKNVSWLMELRNVWMTAKGDVFTMVSQPTLGVGAADMYVYGGGLLPHEWRKPLSRVRTKIPFALLDTQCRHTLAFALAKYHGSTYYHVMAQQIPRLLTFWETASAVLRVGGVLVGPRSGVMRTTLKTFGIPSSGYRPISSTKACFFDRLLLPEPFDEGRYNHECIRRTTDDTIRYVFAGAGRLPVLPANVSERRKLVGKRGTPSVILIERATFRLGPLCFPMRCMANFHALKDAISQEFGAKIRLTVLSPHNRNLMRQSIQLFRKADVVVGVHGAAFHNVAHMRGYGTYALHLGWNTPGFYAEWARKHHVEHINIVTPGCTHAGISVYADIRVVVSEIRRALQLEGFVLDPPVRAIGRKHYQHLLITTTSAR